MGSGTTVSNTGTFLPGDLGSGVGSCNFIMLNPSTATEIEDDPTIRRCKGFVRDWGYRYLIVTNLSPRRTPSPRRLRAYGLERLEIHERNVSVLEHHATHSNLVVAAWGFHGSIHRLGDAGRLALRRVSRPVYCLGKVKRRGS